MTLMFMLSACATQTKAPFKKFKPKQKPAAVESTQPAPKPRMEVIKQEPKPPAMNATPKARASSKQVETGKIKFYDNAYEDAQRAFQQAINIDPENGIAYYYLARTKYELGNYQQALGVLDKAETLLQGSSEWEETIKALREMIEESAE